MYRGLANEPGLDCLCVVIAEVSAAAVRRALHVIVTAVCVCVIACSVCCSGCSFALHGGPWHGARTRLIFLFGDVCVCVIHCSKCLLGSAGCLVLCGCCNSSKTFQPHSFCC